MRDICTACQLPNSHCICRFAKSIVSTVKISVLQHPDEQKHPKNTLRLAKLCLPDMAIWVGENPKDFEQIAQQCSQAQDGVGVIFPSQSSHALENVTTENPNHLIYIDATWRKAFKIWSLNPWLQAFPSYHFNDAPMSQYQLRKTSRAEGLSSLEAIAYGLRLTAQVDPAPLHEIQRAWVDQKRALMPKDIQQRYEP